MRTYPKVAYTVLFVKQRNWTSLYITAFVRIKSAEFLTSAFSDPFPVKAFGIDVPVILPNRSCKISPTGYDPV